MSARDLAQRKPRQRERGYDIFQSGLLNGVIEAGQFLTHREIGVLTGLPLRGVRELVARLEGEGLLTVTPQRGVKVADVDVSLIRNAFQLRRFLEREAVMEYCASASDDELAARRIAHETVLRQATESAPDPAMIDRFHAADRGLHDAIIDSLGNPLIADTYRINAIKIRLIRRTQIRVEKFMAQTMREHLAIIAACEARDRFVAAEAMGVHIDSTMRRVIGVD